MALGEIGILSRSLVEDDPECLSRRRSRFESGRHLCTRLCSADGLGFLSGKPDYAMLELLIELGADIEARDDQGRTPLAVAMLHSDREAMRLLRIAGAAEPENVQRADIAKQMAAVAGSVKKSDPMFRVPDMRATVRWYESIGFTVVDRYEEGGELMFAKLSFGKCEFGLSPGGAPGPATSASGSTQTMCTSCISYSRHDKFASRMLR